MNTESLYILGVRLDRGTFASILAKCAEWLNASNAQGRQIVTVNPEFIMEAQRNEQFRSVLNNADLRIADGIGLVWGGAFFYGWPNRPHRITGVDLTWELAKLAHDFGKTIYLVGGLDGVARRAADEIQRRFLGTVVGAEMGLINGTQKETDELIQRICCARPDILLVAWGAPQQDLWIAKYLQTMPSVRIALGVGGTLDYIAGVVPRAPRAIRKLGFEWLYRLTRQPRRLNRIITATIRYPLALLRQKWNQK